MKPASRASRRSRLVSLGSVHAMTTLDDFKQSYVKLFGEMPPLPAKKFEFFEAEAPAALLGLEAVRSHAFFEGTLDDKTTQLVIFGVLLAEGAGPAEWHAIAARRCGATWAELAHVVEIVAAVKALGPASYVPQT